MRRCHKENQLFLINFQGGRFEKWWQANTRHASSLCVCVCAACACVCACCLFRLHPSPPSSHLQAENCTSSNCLTFYGSEIVSLSLMDNDGASPCYVNLCDNETTEQPRRSTGGSWEKADNPGRAARSCLTTRPRAPRGVTPSAAHPHGRLGGEGGVGCHGSVLLPSPFSHSSLWFETLMFPRFVNLPAEVDESADSWEVRVLICKLKEDACLILSRSSLISFSEDRDHFRQK